MDAGIDVVSDGEQGKPGFANYVKDRHTGLVAREVSAAHRRATRRSSQTSSRQKAVP